MVGRPRRHPAESGTLTNSADFQAKGWTTKELLPLMKKHETYQRACNNRDLHGFEGPIKVSFGNYTYPVCQDFLRATESQGIPTTDDLQDLVTGHGAEHWLKWINRYAQLMFSIGAQD